MRRQFLYAWVGDSEPNKQITGKPVCGIMCWRAIHDGAKPTRIQHAAEIGREPTLSRRGTRPAPTPTRRRRSTKPARRDGADHRVQGLGVAACRAS